ncbi:MAG: von Willebrand factor type A domain-containing protein [Clostridia bacterium]|nr:von Willebrand factor type A domain-containing protein [Clostridia bacterium]
MKKKFALTSVALIGAACIGFCACSASNEGWSGDNGWSGEIASPDAVAPGNNYDYNPVIETDFKTTKDEASSYFSLDRNTATYSLVRRQITNNRTVAADSVRIEEMINYFGYDFTAPTDKAVAVSSYLAPCPWNEENMLMLAGVKTSEYNVDSDACNYVFLIDVSGSMNGKDRIGLAKYGINKLVDNLDDNSTVSLVTYASGVKTHLAGVGCTAKGKTDIKSTVDGLIARGATNGGDGLKRAYDLAEKNFIQNGNNRVILISDGDFNVGMTSQNSLKELIQDKAESGVYLSVLGVGLGNTRDSILETLATCGNGNYAYLDNELEAEKVLVHELNGTLKTVAKDAKAGVTFDADKVEKYRLIGYDTKIISEDDFNNEHTDAGEIGSNLCVAALYEIKLADFTLPESEDADAKLADIEIRYKDVRTAKETNESVKSEVYLVASSADNDDFKFITCVAEFGLILRQSKYKGTASFDSVLDRLESLSGYTSSDPLKQEFVTLVGKASENPDYSPSK